MIIANANEPNALNAYQRHSIQSKYRTKDSFHLILRDDRAIDSQNVIKLIPSQYLDKIRNKELLLIIDFALESSFHFVDTIYQHIIINLNIDENQILFVCSSYDFKDYVTFIAKKYNKKPIACEYYSFFEYMSKHFVNQYNLSNCNPLLCNHEKLYINLNRHLRIHRVALISLLHEFDLLDLGYNSFTIDNRTEWKLQNYTWEKWVSDASYLTHLTNVNKVLDLEKKFPLLLDTNNFDNNLAYTDQNPIMEYVNKSLLSLVTETNYVTGKPLFLTEKTFKPIGLKHPFILVSRPYTLKFLKTLGYKTFEGIINEEYDNEPDDYKRLMLIINELKRLNILSAAELNIFKEQCLPIVEHNFNVLMNKKTYIYDLT